MAIPPGSIGFGFLGVFPAPLLPRADQSPMQMCFLLNGNVTAGVSYGELLFSDGGPNWLSLSTTLNQVMEYPSVSPVRSGFDITIPRTGTQFVDNVASIVNDSFDPAVGYGNAAWRFCDPNRIERGAMGYSRCNTIQPYGYLPNLLYCEIGNLTPGDVDDTDFAVVVSHLPGTVHFPNTTLKAIEVVSSTGDIRFRTQGIGVVTSENDFYIGELGTPRNLALNGATTRLRVREFETNNQFAVTTNVSGFTPSVTKDDEALAAWKVSVGTGTDQFSIARCAPASTTFTEWFAVSGAGQIRAPGVVPLNFANDAAAAAAGVPISGIYHNAGALRIRIV